MTDVAIRALGPDEEDHIRLVAKRMRLTLVEVVGQARGEAMYTMDWLIDRVRQHLDPAIYEGAVLLAWRESACVGHTIVRVETEDGGVRHGLFSTFYVVPEQRGSGAFDHLVQAGEAWMRGHNLASARTYTATDNVRLHRAMARHGYQPLFEKGEFVALGRLL